MSVVELVDYIIALIFSFTTLFIFGSFIGYRNKHDGIAMSASMYLYMGCCTLQSFCATWHLIYMIALWRKDTVIYNGYILYSTGAPSVFLQFINALAVNFLGLDRIASIIVPLFFTAKKRLYFACFYLVFLICLIIKCSVDFIIPDFPSTPFTKCQSYGCMNQSKAIDWFLCSRYGIAAFNFFVAIILGILLHKRFAGHRTRTNKVILITAVVAIIFDFIPHFSAFILIKVSKRRIALYWLIFFNNCCLFGIFLQVEGRKFIYTKSSNHFGKQTPLELFWFFLLFTSIFSDLESFNGLNGTLQFGIGLTGYGYLCHTVLQSLFTKGQRHENVCSGNTRRINASQ